MSLALVVAPATTHADTIKDDVTRWIGGHAKSNVLTGIVEQLMHEKVVDPSLDIRVLEDVPSWIKAVAELWINGDISDREFYDVIGYVTNMGIIASGIPDSTGGMVVVAAQASEEQIRTAVQSYPDSHGESQSALVDSPGVAVDGDTGTIYVTYGSKDGHVTQILLIASHDGGNTWSDPVQVSRESGVRMPHASPAYVDVGPSGEVYVLYQTKLSDQSWTDKGFTFGFTSLHLAVSHNGGESFLPSNVVYPMTGPDQVDRDLLRSKNYDSLHVADNGRVYITWLESQGQVDGEWPPTTVKVTWTDDEGATFAQPRTVQSGVCECCATSSYSSSDSSIHVLFRDILDNPKGLTFRDIVVATSDDDGDTWNVPQRIADDRFEIDSCPHSTSTITADNNNNLHAAWWTMGGQIPGTYYSMSGDDGVSWTTPRLLDGNDWYPATQVKITVDSHGTPVVVWTDRSSEHRSVKYAIVDGASLRMFDLGHGDHAWSDSDGGVTALVWADHGRIFFKSWYDNA